MAISIDFLTRKIEANPFELLSYFCYADYIITDTFHGAVLSIKYSKQFAVWIRDSNKQKLGDLLERLNQWYLGKQEQHLIKFYAK